MLASHVIIILAEVPTTDGLSAKGDNVCAKCGAMKKSGKLSCCARGGAWFKNCGEVDNTKFDHTWVEGIQACNSFASSVSVKAQMMFGHQGVLMHRQNNNQSRNETGQYMNIYDPPDSGLADSACKDCIGLSSLISCICVMNFHLRA